MFDSTEYPKGLDEELFETWLEKGRESGIGYKFMLVIWDSLYGEYRPQYIDEREKMFDYQLYENATHQESIIAIYDLYSESRITRDY